MRCTVIRIALSVRISAPEPVVLLDGSIRVAMVLRQQARTTVRPVQRVLLHFQVSKLSAAAASAGVQHSSAVSAAKDNSSLMKALQKKLAQHDQQEAQHKTQVRSSHHSQQPTKQSIGRPLLAVCAVACTMCGKPCQQWPPRT